MSRCVAICRVCNNVYVALADDAHEVLGAVEYLFKSPGELLKVTTYPSSIEASRAYDGMEERLRFYPGTEDIRAARRIEKDRINKRIGAIHKSDLGPLEKIEAWIIEGRKLYHERERCDHYKMFRIKNV